MEEQDSSELRFGRALGQADAQAPVAASQSSVCLYLLPGWDGDLNRPLVSEDVTWARSSLSTLASTVVTQPLTFSPQLQRTWC